MGKCLHIIILFSNEKLSNPFQVMKALMNYSCIKNVFLRVESDAVKKNPKIPQNYLQIRKSRYIFALEIGSQTIGKEI